MSASTNQEEARASRLTERANGLADHLCNFLSMVNVDPECNYNIEEALAACAIFFVNLVESAIDPSADVKEVRKTILNNFNDKIIECWQQIDERK